MTAGRIHHDPPAESVRYITIRPAVERTLHTYWSTNIDYRSPLVTRMPRFATTAFDSLNQPIELKFNNNPD
jgi:hypothetical protein